MKNKHIFSRIPKLLTRNDLTKKKKFLFLLIFKHLKTLSHKLVSGNKIIFIFDSIAHTFWEINLEHFFRKYYYSKKHKKLEKI